MDILGIGPQYSQWRSYRIIESENTWGLKNLWRPSSPTLFSEHGQLEQVVQGCVRSGFECLQGQRLYSPSRQPVPVFNQRQNK